MNVPALGLLALIVPALAACDPSSSATPSAEKLEMERACALDVRGTATLDSIGGAPAVGTITVDGAAENKNAVTITLARTQSSAAEEPFFAQMESADRTAPIVFSTGANRFIGGGTTGNEHSEVTATASTPAVPGPCGSDASIDHELRLVFQESLAEVEGSLTLTFRERRQNVVLEGATDHAEQRSFAIRATRAEPLASPRTPECEAAIERFQQSQSL